MYNIRVMSFSEPDQLSRLKYQCEVWTVLTRLMTSQSSSRKRKWRGPSDPGQMALNHCPWWAWFSGNRLVINFTSRFDFWRTEDPPFPFSPFESFFGKVCYVLEVDLEGAGGGATPQPLEPSQHFSIINEWEEEEKKEEEEKVRREEEEGKISPP